MNLERVLADILGLRKKLDAILLEPFGGPRRRIDRRVKTYYRNIVTKFDKNAEKEIVETLSKRYPDVGIVAEESRPEGSIGPDSWTWCIDPLDGTVNYSYGHPFFAVSVALLRGRTPAVGVVHLPIQRETFWAVSGRGAYLNGRRIRVGRTENLRASLLATGFPYVRNRAFWSNLRAMNRLLPGVRDFRRGGAAAIDLAFVSCGRLDGYFESGLSAWDVSAGALLVKESGGSVSDWRGGDGWMDRREIVASNPKIHSALLRRLRQFSRLCLLVSIFFLPGTVFADSADPESSGGPDQSPLSEAVPNSSAIDKPDFRIRNLPFSAETASGGVLEKSSIMDIDASGMEMTGHENILSMVPDALVIKYLDRTDHEKHLTARQMAEKYIFSPGSAVQNFAGESDDSVALRWMMMSDKEQIAAKTAWFRASQSSISIDDFNRVVDLRAYRVLAALNHARSPDVRKVEAPGRISVYEIERLKMPELRPLGEWSEPAGAAPEENENQSAELPILSTEAPQFELPPPTIRPIMESSEIEFEEPPAAVEEIEMPPSADPIAPVAPAIRTIVDEEPVEEMRKDRDAVAVEKIPSRYGIPSGLRNGP